MKQKMRLSDLKDLDKDTITPAIAAQILGCDPQYIRIAARKRPDLLRFPTSVHGNRVNIPKEGFIRFMESYGLMELFRSTIRGRMTASKETLARHGS